MTGASLLGVGVASPTGELDQEAAIAIAQARCCADERQAAWLRRIYRHTGIRTRGSVLLGADDGARGFETFYPLPSSAHARGPTTAERLERYAREAGPLAARACHAALSDAALEPSEITHLVTVSCTGMVSPGMDAELIRRLDLPVDVGRLNLGFMGCHGALNGLRAAGGLVREQARSRVLVCCVELCSLHFQYGWEPQKVVANGLFADGAGAAVLAPDTAREEAWRLVELQSRLIAGTGAAMTWTVGDHGFEMTLSHEVPRLIRHSLREWLAVWLARHGMTVNDVAHWAIHPGGPEILRAAGEALALPEEACRASSEVLRTHGNMSSPTLLFVLDRLRARRAHGPCVMLGFGPGLSFEAALLVQAG